MDESDELRIKVLMAARDNGINSIFFRNAMAKKLGLNIADSVCLTLLGIRGVSSAKEIARYTGLTSGSTTAMLDRLEKKNFIRRKDNPNDRRGVLVEINEEYGKVAGNLVVGIQKAHNELISNYTDDELKIIADFLNRFSNNLIEHTEAIEKELV